MTDRMRPIIGVTGPDEGGAAAWLFTGLAVALAGGHAVRITPRRPRNIDGLHGLILGGGADVDPSLYGAHEAELLPKQKSADESWLMYILEWLLFPLTWLARKLSGLSKKHGGDKARDTLEMSLLAEAARRGLPVLGVCRGQQLINVFFGGTLHRDLAGFYVEDPEVRTILPRKVVLVEHGARLARYLGRGPERVNALHRHAIDRLGDGLRVAARDRNGIVQAIEHTSFPLLLGVQWHPEYLPQIPAQRAIFHALVHEARKAARVDTASKA
jgi:putative glutamine amidotransferase